MFFMFHPSNVENLSPSLCLYIEPHSKRFVRFLINFCKQWNGNVSALHPGVEGLNPVQVRDLFTGTAFIHYTTGQLLNPSTAVSLNCSKIGGKSIGLWQYFGCTSEQAFLFFRKFKFRKNISYFLHNVTKYFGKILYIILSYRCQQAKKKRSVVNIT